MKNLILFITIFGFAQIANAQISNELPSINPKDLKLKGPVKEVIDSNYLSEPNQATVDTLQKYLKTVRRFDKNGNEIYEVAYDENNNILRKSTYDYSQNKVVKIKRLYDTLGLFDESIFKLNGKGLKIQCDYSENQIFNGVQDTIRMKYIFKYDSLDRTKEVDIQYKDTLAERILYLYNNKNRLVENREYQGNSSTYSKTIYEYDLSRNQTKSVDYFIDGRKTMENSYVFSRQDKWGNWHLIISVVKDAGLINQFQNGILKKGITYY